MISKLLVSVLLMTSVSLGGQKFSFTLDLLQGVKGYGTVDSVAPLAPVEQRFMATFTHEEAVHYLICEPVQTKSGIITYLAVLDASLKVTAMALPSYQNKHNASLTSRAFLRQFRRSKPASKPIRRGYQVDAISGATQSTDVLIAAVNQSTAALAQIISE